MTTEPIAAQAIIIGAGPVGLFTVFEMGINNIRCHLVDGLDRIGGQCAELYPEKPIYDIPAVPVCTGQELTDRLMEQIKPFNPVFHMGQMATALEKLPDGGWRVTTDAGTILEAPVVVIASGGGSFVPKKLPLPNIESYEGNSLFYAVRQKDKFRGKHVVIAGGGDSALDWLRVLQPDAASIALVHRRDEFRAAPDSVGHMRQLVAAGKAALQIGQLVEVTGTGTQITGVTLKSESGTTSQIPCDCLLAFYGLTMKPGPVAEFGLVMQDHMLTVDQATFETSAPGVFAVGDICTYPGKMKLILSGFHEAALAAKRAFALAHPGERYRFQYTTSSSDLHSKLGVEK
ncbi:MAG: NAD(P)/FAD-dependent oxidoreductase [Alphaproteobacteria bacterium]|nr:MAG: NAD(P)/FAD-dependent oxidoreductase [Alphaproteobacteria bacterium]